MVIRTLMGIGGLEAICQKRKKFCLIKKWQVTGIDIADAGSVFGDIQKQIRDVHDHGCFAEIA